MQVLNSEPILDAGSLLMVRAYAELSTCRAGGMGPGPIPWTAMLEWARYHGLERDTTDHLISVLRIVDREMIRRAIEDTATPPIPKKR